MRPCCDQNIREIENLAKNHLFDPIQKYMADALEVQNDWFSGVWCSVSLKVVPRPLKAPERAHPQAWDLRWRARIPFHSMTL